MYVITDSKDLYLTENGLKTTDIFKALILETEKEVRLAKILLNKNYDLISIDKTIYIMYKGLYVDRVLIEGAYDGDENSFVKEVTLVASKEYTSGWKLDEANKILIHIVASDEWDISDFNVEESIDEIG